MQAGGRRRTTSLVARILIWVTATTNCAAFNDAHLHYDADIHEALPPARISEVLDAAGIDRAVITSRPPQLVAELAAAQPGRVLPLLGVYENAVNKETWMYDAALPGRLARRLDAMHWCGIGELHLFAAGRHSAVFQQVVELAVERDLALLIHGDPAVIDALFELAPAARVVWAHAGAYPYPPLLADYLRRHPNLYIDTSVRDERIAPDGVLDDDWAWLFMEYPERFLVGVDTFRPERWAELPSVARTIRAWLAQLPPDVATLIAHENLPRIYRCRLSDSDQ